MSYAALLTHECNVTRTSQTADSSGGYTTAEVTILRRIPCRFNAMSGKDYALYADKLGTLAGFTVFMEGGRDVREGDLLVKTDDSRQFDVKLRKDFDEQKRFLTLICAERARVVE
jgi:head-tail adaptor